MASGSSSPTHPTAAEGREPAAPTAAQVIAQAKASGAKIETITIDQDVSISPAACPHLPSAPVGCANGGGEFFVDRQAIDRWVVNLTLTWTPSTPVMGTLNVHAMKYYACGFGCTAGGNQTAKRQSGSPLSLSAVLDLPVANAKGLWFILSVPDNTPAGALNTGQMVHAAGDVVAIDDP